MIKHLFYDMDDTLVRTRSNWIAATWAYAQAHQLPVPFNEITTLLGKNCRDICVDLDRSFRHVGNEGVDFHADELRRLLRDEFDRDPPGEIPGATQFLRTMAKRCQQYIVSGSPLEVVSQVVMRNHWSPYIQKVVSSESVRKGKPDPEVYDRLRSSLHAKRVECLIFEDSPAGVEAARRAGIRCICINPQVPVPGSELLLQTVPDFATLLASPHLLESIDSDSL
ncbi:MAG: hypothetical protein CVV52_05685 [Spirochaetae bacterium HGW-Spirochaetae-8]|jgi:HAD superfamily hydrolase (TIGR01509 family)|nr:MAG: hypothetical protein CVV52_05685 [Spirochaetae bacterium HGW-Spirochaetae-8]